MINDTKYENLNKTLNAVGKAVFVQFYYQFKDTQIGFKELSQYIINNNPRSVSDNQRFRIPRARYIFDNNFEIEALINITNTNRLTKEIITLARTILANELKELDIENESKFISEINDENLNKSQQEYIYDNSIIYNKDKIKSVASNYTRDISKAKNALKLADYKCEFDKTHKVFIRKNSNENYTEPHHLIPLSAVGRFDGLSLDREQNIVSLCSHCHNLIHYGRDNREIITFLYYKRIELLREINLDISLEDLMKYY